MKRNRNRFGLVETLKTLRQLRIAAAVGLLALAFASSPQADELVVATGDVVAGKELTQARWPAINDTGDLVFQGIWRNDSGAYESGVFLVADGTEALLAATSDIVAGKELTGAGLPAINDARDVVFQGRWRNDSGGEEYRIFLLAADGTEALLAAPGDIVAGKELLYASSPTINDVGDVVFHAQWTNDAGGYGGVGVFLVATDGTEALLAARGDIVTGKELILAIRPAINDAGDVVFQAQWTNDSGLYEYGIFLLVADGTQALLAAPGDIVAGKELTYASFPFINDAGDVVLEGLWTNDSGGYGYGVFLLPNVGAADLLDLLDQLILDVDARNARNGIKNSLDSKLDNALDSLEAINADQRQDAVNKINAFINSVEAQRGENISDEEADFLIDSALEIIRLIGA